MIKCKIVVDTDFNIPHSPKICHSRNTEVNFIDQINLIGIYRIFHPHTAEGEFFLAVCRTFSKVDHILRHKTSLKKY